MSRTAPFFVMFIIIIITIVITTPEEKPFWASLRDSAKAETVLAQVLV